MTATFHERALARARRQRLLLIDAGAALHRVARVLDARYVDVIRDALATYARDDRQTALEILATDADHLVEWGRRWDVARLVIALTTLKGRDRYAAWTDARDKVTRAERLSGDESEADEVVWDARADADEALYALTPHSVSTP